MFDFSIAPSARRRRTIMLMASVTFLMAHPRTGICESSNNGEPNIKISISSNFPSDIVGGASNATPQQAAQFAWEEFIALNWPAVAKTDNLSPRDTPDTSKLFGDPAPNPLVWHTFRGKVEIFPGGLVDPPGYENNSATDYGYDVRPAYIYENGLIKPAGPAPWINLDENSQISLDQIYAGVVSGKLKGSDSQILFMAKANRVEYKYIASKRLWDEANRIKMFKATKNYINSKSADPPAGSKSCVSFPYGSVEIKAAWRKLTSGEKWSGRFYTTRVRYYMGTGKNIRYVDDELGLVGLHIIQKTHSAPYFIYATFEQADNITDSNGNALEDENGKFKYDYSLEASLRPDIHSVNAKPGATQYLYPLGLFLTNPGGRLYYQNTPNTGLPADGIIFVNQRINRIPDDIIAVNKLAHEAISAYTKEKFGKWAPNSVWSYYKLINVQATPLPGKMSSIDYSKPDASTYYQSNSVIETDYNLQKFSGVFDGFNDTPKKLTISDFDKSPPYKALANVRYNGSTVNMGGCMGCHGNAQGAGAGFSFILLDGRVQTPEAAGVPVTQEQIARLLKYLHKPEPAVGLGSASSQQYCPD
ncbi:hypothetical protein B0G76_2571 [Paraburkholderia sp. BL23I1N1]|uniref:hypothetical protein n=1 Tax=Paraburkholderia sp. BL23I1N1 TaxID=1938802 RepID=UPI000FF3F8EC|nr:hypothetical protein [Paraburkholderia sp. BL23I1N1]RKE36393.1 hypothetical protein B0G76_2571 [Paraburkholderia sp. BL23I1N1]